MSALGKWQAFFENRLATKDSSAIEWWDVVVECEDKIFNGRMLRVEFGKLLASYKSQKSPRIVVVMLINGVLSSFGLEWTKVKSIIGAQDIGDDK